MSRWPALLLLLLLAGGCTLAQRPSPAESGAQELFVRGLDQLAAGREATAFTLLAERFPTSRWSLRGQTVAALQQKLQASNTALQALRQEKNRCMEDYTHLGKETEQLRSDLEKMKKLMIENELRSQ